jgi:6-phosphogluconolactonase
MRKTGETVAPFYTRLVKRFSHPIVVVILATIGFADLSRGTGAAPAVTHLVYIGTYTGATSQGIYGFRFDDATGALTPIGLVAETQSPSFLTASASGRFVFAVNEFGTYGGEKSGSVTSFVVDPATSKLTPLGVQSSRGADPCHLALDRSGRYLAVANYTGGNFALFPVDASGRLGPARAVVAGEGSGPVQSRQQGPHAHMVAFDATNKYLIGADLGLDRLLVYRFDASAGTLMPNDPAGAVMPPGAGPRHFAFHPNGRDAFSINELSSTITRLTWDGATGRFAVGGSQPTLPAEFKGNNSTAEIAVHPSGRFVYGSNRGHDTIAVFSIGADGALTLVEHEPTRGRSPRNFTIDPTGRWLIAANQQSGSLAVFQIDQKTGALEPVGPLATVGSPVSVLFVN